MLLKLKQNYFVIASTLLIIYFLINFFGGERGLFAYFEKQETIKKLKVKEVDFNKKINQLETENSLLTDKLDLDYVDVLLREMFLLGKSGESTYIIVSNES